MTGTARVVDLEDPTDGRQAASVWSAERRPLTTGLVATVTLVAFEALAVATIMPLAGRELGDTTLYGWTFTAFFLASMVGIVGAGTAVDRYGVRTPFVVAVAVFAIGLVVGGLAVSMPMLVAGRAIQGVGAGVLTPVAYVMIARGYPHAARPKMFAILSSAWVVPALIGPAVAGWLGDHFSWRVVFVGLLPIIMVAGALTLSAVWRVGRTLDADSDADGERATTDTDAARRLGLAVLAMVGTALLVAALSRPLELFGVVSGVVGVAVGLPAVAGLLPAGTLRSREGLPAAVFGRGALTFAFFGAEAYFPLALVSVRGTTALAAGLAITAGALSWSAGSWVQANRNAGWGERRLVALGFGFVLAGVVGSAAVLVPALPIFVSIAAWALAGFGMGLAYSSFTLLVLRTATPSEQGRSTAALSLSEVIGTAIGTGLGGAALAAATSIGLGSSVGIALAFAIAASVAAIGLLLAGRLSGRPDAGKSPDD